MSASLLERLADVMRSSGELKVRAVADVRWADEEASTAPLGPMLEVIVLLVVERFDTNADGLISRKELRLRRRAQGASGRRG